MLITLNILSQFPLQLGKLIIFCSPTTLTKFYVIGLSSLVSRSRPTHVSKQTHLSSYSSPIFLPSLPDYLPSPKLPAITTVGYGEITPRSFLGRLITVPLLICGLLLIALPSFVLGREFSSIWEKMGGKRGDRMDTDDVRITIIVGFLFIFALN